MHPPGSRNVRKLLLFISRVSTLVYFEDAQVIAHLCYPVPFRIELVIGSPLEVDIILESQVPLTAIQTPQIEPTPTIQHVGAAVANV
jgi:hypothetical protein